MKKLALNNKEKKVLKKLSSKPFSGLTNNKQKLILELGAKDFSARFTQVIKKLAKE